MTIVLLVLFVVWIYLLNELFHLLENEYPEKYDEMGQPRLFSLSKWAEGSTQDFILFREYRELEGRKVKNLGNMLFVIFVVFSVIVIYGFYKTATV